MRSTPIEISEVVANPIPFKSILEVEAVVNPIPFMTILEVEVVVDPTPIIITQGVEVVEPLLQEAYLT